MLCDDLVRNSCIAAGQFSTVGAALTVGFARGLSGVYTAAGVATYTLDRGVDIAQGGVMVTPILTTFAAASVLHTSDEVKIIKTWDAAGAALECVYYVNVVQNVP